MILRHPWKLSIVFCVMVSSYLLSDAMADGNAPSGFGGVGLEIIVQEGVARVVAVVSGSPAEKVGIIAGDVITQINGEPVSEMKPGDVVNKIRGPEGTGISLNLKRTTQDGQEREFSVTINREFIPSNTVTTTSGNPGLLGGVPTANSILYFTPLSSRVSPAKPFELSIVLDNPKGINADDLGLWIQYNTQAVTLLGTKDLALFELDSAAFIGWNLVTTFHHSSKGELFLRLKAKNEDQILSGKLGILRFQATGKVPVSEIYFRFNNSWGSLPNTFMTYKGKDVLGKELDHADGAISETVRVLREDQLSE